MAATGVRILLSIKNGRLELISGDAYKQQLIRVALSNCTNNNPFQDIGLGQFMIFELNTQDVESQIRHRVLKIFESFERDHLMKIRNPHSDIKFFSEGSEKYMSLDYFDIETQERQEITVPISTD